MNKLMTLFFQLMRFGSVGAMAAFVHLGLVYLLVNTGYAPIYANIPAFFIAFQVSYWGHRWWTFRDTNVLHHIALAKLLLLQLLNFAANQSLFYFFLQLHLPYLLALFFVLTILPIATFVLSKRWVFVRTSH